MRRLLLISLFLAVPAQVSAQTSELQPLLPALNADRFKKQAPAPRGSDVTKQIQFTDWMLVCRKMVNAIPGKKENCEIFNTVTLKGNTSPFAMMFIGRVDPGQPLQLSLLLPNNISIGHNPKLMLGENTPPTDLTWARCLPVGCFSGVPLKDHLEKTLREAGKPGVMKFVNGIRQEISFPVSLNGLGAAIDALNAENKPN